jgi:hypothetical protein
LAFNDVSKYYFFLFFFFSTTAAEKTPPEVELADVTAPEASVVEVVPSPDVPSTESTKKAPTDPLSASSLLTQEE